MTQRIYAKYLLPGERVACDPAERTRVVRRVDLNGARPPASVAVTYEGGVVRCYAPRDLLTVGEP